MKQLKFEVEIPKPKKEQMIIREWIGQPNEGTLVIETERYTYFLYDIENQKQFIKDYLQEE